MRTLTVLTMIMLMVSAVPLAFGQVPDESAPLGPADETDPTVAALMARIAELEAKVAALTGGDGGQGGGQTQQPCPPSGGCVRLPFAVDEIGDDMTGDLNMIDHSLIKFIPEDQQDARGGAPRAATVLGPEFFDVNAQTNFTQLVKLHQNATLNTTGGAKVFIDFDGHLTFADGSFMTPDQATLNQDTTFTQNVTVLRNITIREGGTIIFENNTSILQAGNFSRIGTSTDNPFFIIANNTTAMAVHPGPTADDAASIVGGHPNNNVTGARRGSFIAGGGSAAEPNRVDGDFSTILGGRNNHVHGDDSIAAGRSANAGANNTFVWNGGSGAFTGSTDGTFLVNATGGLGINTAAPVSPLTVDGNITPAQDGVNSLGEPANRWHQLYMSSEIDFVTELLYTSGGATVMRLDDQGNLSFAGSLQGDASGLKGITASAIESESLTGDQIANGTIDDGDLANGAVTAAKIGEVCPVGNVLKSDGSGWACGVDVDTTYGAGFGLTQDGTTFVVDSTDVQRRVIAGCAAGSSIRTINEDGSVICELDDDSNSDTLGALACTTDQVAKYDDLTETWACGNDEDTTYGAGFGVDLVGTTFGIDATEVQRRVSSECAVGSSIRAIGEDGTITCETDDMVSSLPWTSITDKPAGFADDLDGDSLGDLNCSTLQIIRWDGAAWVCADDTAPARPPGGTIVGPFDADRDAPLVSTAFASWLCYVDDDGSGTFNTDESIYVHFSDTNCDSSSVSIMDLRLTSVAGHAAFTKVRAADADFGNGLATYVPFGSSGELLYHDADGTATVGRGDTIYSDQDESGTVTVGDYRWTARGASFDAATVVLPGDADVDLVLVSLGSLGSKIMFWDVDNTGAVTSSDPYYVQLLGGGVVSPNTSLRAGDLGSVS